MPSTLIGAQLVIDESAFLPRRGHGDFLRACHPPVSSKRSLNDAVSQTPYVTVPYFMTLHLHDFASGQFARRGTIRPTRPHQHRAFAIRTKRTSRVHRFPRSLQQRQGGDWPEPRKDTLKPRTVKNRVRLVPAECHGGSVARAPPWYAIPKEVDVVGPNPTRGSHILPLSLGLWCRGREPRLRKASRPRPPDFTSQPRIMSFTLSGVAWCHN